MFQFNDKVIDELISKDIDTPFILNITNKYKLYIIYKSNNVFMYVKEFNETRNEYVTMAGSLRDISFDKKNYDDFKNELKRGIMSYLSNLILSNIKFNEKPGSLMHQYLSFLSSKGIFNAKKLFIYYYHNIAVISCEYHTERELFYIRFGDNSFSYVKEFRYVNETDYDIYNPFLFISNNNIFSQSLYYKDLKLELAYLI